MSRVVHELVEDALRELADEPYHRALWLASDGPEVSSFTECVSRLWDDSGLAGALEKGEGVYDAEIDSQLLRLSAVLGRIDDSRAPEAILKDPQLALARTMASSLLQELRHFGSDGSS